jgi:uncharacterized Zn finger protein
MTSENKAVNAFFEEFPNAPCVHEVAGQLFHDNAEEAAKARAAFYGCAMETTKNPKLINEIMNRVKSELKALKALKAGETEVEGSELDVEIDETEVETESEGSEVETESVKITPEVKPKAPKKSGKKKAE